METSAEQLTESEPTNPRHIQRRIWLIAVVALAGAFGLAWFQSRALPKRFGVVEPGRLYRSGTVTPAQLETLSHDYHIHTVLSLLNADAPETVAEHEAAKKLGLRWINVPLPGNGASTSQQREQIKKVLFDDSLAPLLVHCAAGTNRTGLAVGMYRLYRDDWTLDEVRTEMHRFDFEDDAHHENLREALKAEAAEAAAAR